MAFKIIHTNCLELPVYISVTSNQSFCLHPDFVALYGNHCATPVIHIFSAVLLFTA